MKVIIFGNGKFASLAWYCRMNDSQDEVVGFAVDAPYITESKFHGLPVVDFASVEDAFPPGEWRQAAGGSHPEFRLGSAILRGAASWA